MTITFTLHANGYTYSENQWQRSYLWASCEHDGARYRVNLGPDGSIGRGRPLGSKRQDFRILYKNPTVDRYDPPGGYKLHPDYFETKYLDLDAVANAKFRVALEAAITPEAVEAAHVAAERTEREKVAAQAKADSEKLRAAMAHEIERLRLEGKGQAAHDIEAAFADLDDDQVRRLANIIGNS